MTFRPPVRAFLAAGIGAFLAVSLAGQTTERVSVDSAEDQGNSGCVDAALAADGRHVAFASVADDLVVGDTNGHIDVFVRDLQAGTTERVSLGPLGAQADGDSYRTVISGDGRYIAFQSQASNLVAGDTNLRIDVFLRDRQTGVTERVSLDSSGGQANADCLGPVLSSDGRHVAFHSQASNLVAGDSNLRLDVFVHDRQTGVTERVSLDSSGAEGNEDSYLPSLSADGRFVAFESWGTELVASDTNGASDVFVRDRQSGTTERVSVDSSGAQASGISSLPRLSGNGRYVAFASQAADLVAGDGNGVQDIFVHDRQAGTTERVSLDSLQREANAVGREPAISADGRYVAFHSAATNLVLGDTNAFSDVFVRDLQSFTTERVSVGASGQQGNSVSHGASLSADGKLVAFYSVASNLVPGDTNGAGDIFLRTRCAAANSAVFAGDGINADAVTPVDVRVGSTWSAPLVLGHAHGSGGALALKVRTVTVNGPDFVSPLGGRLTETLIGGPLLAILTGTHDGISGDIPAQAIPDQLALVGLAWAAQYTVSGGGFVDLSRAVAGTVGCP